MFRISLCKEDGIIQTEHLITTTFPWDFSAQRSRNQLYAFSTPRVSATMKAEGCWRRRTKGGDMAFITAIEMDKSQNSRQKKDESPS